MQLLLQLIKMKNSLKGVLFIVLLAALSACKKNDDAPKIAAATNLNVINASGDTVNFYLNGSRLNNNDNLYPASASGYFGVLAGAQNYQVKKIFNPVTNLVKTLFNKPLELEANKYYSLFVAGETADLAFRTKDSLQNDTIPNTCLVRFVNASPGAGTLSMALGDTTQFTSVDFGIASDFTVIGISGKKPLKVYQADSATPVFISNIQLLQGKSYTIFSRGRAGGTGTSAFGLGATVNVN